MPGPGFLQHLIQLLFLLEPVRIDLAAGCVPGLIWWSPPFLFSSASSCSLMNFSKASGESTGTTPGGKLPCEPDASAALATFGFFFGAGRAFGSELLWSLSLWRASKCSGRSRDLSLPGVTLDGRDPNLEVPIKEAIEDQSLGSDPEVEAARPAEEFTNYGFGPSACCAAV